MEELAEGLAEEDDDDDDDTEGGRTGACIRAKYPSVKLCTAQRLTYRQESFLLPTTARVDKHE